MTSFSEAFRAARKAKGPNSTFTWNGKTYSTNTKEDEAKKKTSKSSSSAPSSSVRPKSRNNQAPTSGPGAKMTDEARKKFNVAAASAAIERAEKTKAAAEKPKKKSTVGQSQTAETRAYMERNKAKFKKK